MASPLRVFPFLTLSVLCLTPTLAAPTYESAARFVPADIGLFIEGQHLDDLLLPLSAPQAWLTLAELAGQPAREEEAALWRQRVRQTVQMDPDEAIRVLFSEQFAFVGEGLGRAQDSVVLCRPTIDIKTLLQRWEAQPLPTAGRTSVYRLNNRVGLALPYGLIMFGDAAPPDGMFQHVLEFADRKRAGPSLHDDPAYRSLLARAPQDPDGILFARLRPERSTSRPARESGPLSELPGPLRGAANVLLALHRQDSLLHFTAVGDSPAASSDDDTDLLGLVQHLPARTLVAWGVRLDYVALLRSADALPERSIVRIALQMHARAGTTQRLAEQLAPATCFAVGVVEPRTRREPAPPVPALAILTTTRNAAAARAELETLLQATVSVYNLMSLKLSGPAPLRTPRPIRLDTTEVSLLDLSELVAGQPGGGAITELHVCWALDGQTLILASHIDWLRQILAARRGQAPQLAGMLALSQRAIEPGSDTVIAVQTGPIADLGQMWLDYLDQTVPAVLKESWWRQRQPGGGEVRIGIQATELPEQRRLRVSAVAPNGPADGVLKPGDEIVGYHNRRFATSQPAREVRGALVRRPHARWIDLLVERGGTTLIKRVPLPFVDPVQLLRRTVAIGQIAQRVVYHDVSEEAGARGFLTIEPRERQRPLFPFELTPTRPPASQPPASQP